MLHRLLFATMLAGLAAMANAQTADPLADNGSALAPAGDTAAQVAFAYSDRNADELVSWEEYRNRGILVFSRVDTNGDGILQVAEIAAFAGKDAPPAPFDIKIATYNAALRKYFDLGDKDNNGALTPAEWRDTVRPSKIF